MKQNYQTVVFPLPPFSGEFCWTAHRLLFSDVQVTVHLMSVLLALPRLNSSKCKNMHKDELIMEMPRTTDGICPRICRLVSSCLIRS